jgi:hypothetical protein
MDWWILGIGLALVSVSCGSARETDGSKYSKAVDCVAYAIKDFYYLHGSMPQSYRDLEPVVGPLVARCVPEQSLDFSWEILKPRGHLQVAELDAKVRVFERSRSSGKIIMHRDFLIPQAARGAAWFVATSFDGPEKIKVRDEPVNIACALALAVVDERRKTGTWLALGDLPWGSDPILMDIRGRRTTQSFTYRVLKSRGGERLEFSSSQTNELYLFDPGALEATKGLQSAKGLKVVPKDKH